MQVGSAKLEAKEMTLADVFSDAFLFEIPPYQRPYAWRREDAAKLLDDLLDAAEVPEQPPYFLGAINLIKGDDQRAKIIDGQQRLSTITILFCLLREMASPDVQDDLEGHVWQRGSGLLKTPDQYRLQLRASDQQFFQECVQTKGNLLDFLDNDPVEPLSDSQMSIRLNAIEMRERLRLLDNNRLASLAGFLLTRCFLVVVMSSDPQSALRMFQVLNDSGLNLSVADLLKARLIGRLADPSTADDFAAEWEDIEEDVGRDGFMQALAHIRTIFLKDKTRSSLQEELEDQVIINYDPWEFLRNILKPYVSAYRSIRDANYPRNSKDGRIASSLQLLNRLEDSDWMPAAMAYVKDGPQDIQLARSFFRQLERLGCSFAMRRPRSVNERIARYARVTREIQESHDLTDANSALQFTESEKQEIREVLDGSVYTHPAAKMIVLQLDRLIVGVDTPATYDHKILTIEHVLPQTPAEESEWFKMFSEEEQQRWTHAIANLVLLTKKRNTAARNFEFARKKSVYFNSKNTTPLAVTIQVLKCEEWKPAVLKVRQGEIMELFTNDWRL